MKIMSSAVFPTVLKETIPQFSRDPDFRLPLTVVSAWIVSPTKTGLINLTSSHPRLAIAFALVLRVVIPVMIESVTRLDTTGRPNSVREA
ncbi:hypothetical protein A6R70_07650 [Agrobacterium rubi]|nr:hypothetical protein [Agrobacterium rubi]